MASDKQEIQGRHKIGALKENLQNYTYNLGSTEVGISSIPKIVKNSLHI
jgi:hypothetical protein